MTSTHGVPQIPAARVVGQTDDASIAAESAAVESAEGGVAEPSIQPEAAPEQELAASPKVLIVEDATELAEVIAATLERIHIATFHETHVERALDVYYKEHPDVILLDIGLPDKTGWKLMDAIKESDEEDRPLVIVITAHGDPANRLMGKLQGVHSYLIKPFTPNEVEQVVGSALASRHKEAAAADQVVEKISLPELIQELLEGERATPEDDAEGDTEQTGEGDTPVS